MSDITGTRLLRKLIPNVWAVGDSGAWIFAEENGWDYVNPDAVAGMGYVVYRTYFDIAGWSREQLSAFIQGAGFQQAESVYMTVPEEGIGKEWCILSKARIGDDAFDGTHHSMMGNQWHAPGMEGSNYNLEEIFTGRYREYSYDQNTPYSGNLSGQFIWGAGDATAGDKLHVTIALRVIAIDIEQLTIAYPPTSVIVPAVLADEKDLVYMERLRRSYVLAESRNP
jgi:hypothetical protein